MSRSDNEEKQPKQNICDMIMKAGVVGAGGAGFPTHVKLGSQAEIVIANGAECEPLLESDRHLMLREPNKVIDGLKAAMRAVGAVKGILALKCKHSDIIELFKPLIQKEKSIDLVLLDDFYPAGDEHVLAHEVTGRIVPMSGIPLQTGVVVSNVYTLAMISDALENKCFTHRYVTITGEINRPCVTRLPVGISIGEAIEKVGLGTTIKNYVILTGGPMMGRIEEDMEMPVTKTTSGIIVIPADSKLAGLKNLSVPVATRKAKSVCCQCIFCTEICPRFLLGHKLKPHEIMRFLPSSIENNNLESIYSSVLCSECGLCGYYSCTMGLAPNKINAFIKSALGKNNIKPDIKGLKASGVNQFRNDRKVPTQRLITKLGLDRYNMHLPFIDEEFKSSKLTIPLKQHVGASSRSVVKQEDRVLVDSLLAQMPDKGLGANIHSPVDGIVTEVNEDFIKLSIIDV